MRFDCSEYVLFVHECVHKLTGKSLSAYRVEKDHNLCPHGQGEGIVMQNAARYGQEETGRLKIGRSVLSCFVNKLQL